MTQSPEGHIYQNTAKDTEACVWAAAYLHDRRGINACRAITDALLVTHGTWPTPLPVRRLERFVCITITCPLREVLHTRFVHVWGFERLGTFADLGTENGKGYENTISLYNGVVTVSVVDMIISVHDQIEQKPLKSGKNKLIVYKQ